MSYSEALSARLVSRWEPVSRNQLLVVLLFFFFNPSVKKSVAKNRSQNFRLAVVETVIYHLPLWRFVIYVSVVCLFSGKLQPRRQMLLLPRPGANKGRENGMIPSVILFFLIFLFVDFDWPSAAWMKWEWRCSQIAFQREQKPWQLLTYRTLFSFIPELLFFCLFQSNKVVTPTLLALFRSTFNVSSRQFWDVHYKLLKYSGWITQNCI